MNSKLKRFAIFLIAHPYASRPRWWVRALVNPLMIKRGAGSKIRSSVRLDIFPYHRLTLGRRSIIESRSTLNNGVGDITIGDNSRIGIGSTIIAPVNIGSNVHLAQNVVISGLNHNYEDPDRTIHDQGVSKATIEIGDDVWIGANVVVTAGVSIGTHSVIAAGSVVTRSVPAFCLAAGAPARVVKQYDALLKKWIKQ